jgi:hypothetical protein
MRTGLAEKLLVKILDWNPEEISKERPLIQALANFKYDEYQQFSPGIRFIESLVKWLSQFEQFRERQVAYNFIKSQLIFISNEQISHLVNMAYTAKINPILIHKTADILKVNDYLIKKIIESNEYQNIRRKSLFIGLSDGSRIDQLRRSNNNISNEQVSPTYSISIEKMNDMLDELSKANIAGQFTTIFLVDDFTASGTSYFRYRDDKWGGKIYKFITSLNGTDGLSKLIEQGITIDIYILFYIATESAIAKLNLEIEAWQNLNPTSNFVFKIDAVQIIGDDIKNQVLNDKPFNALIQTYYDDSIEDKHYKMANHNKPYLGFNECALPLILNHNTPNNSLPLLWFPDDKRFIGLFPRVTRHKE